MADLQEEFVQCRNDNEVVELPDMAELIAYIEATSGHSPPQPDTPNIFSTSMVVELLLDIVK